QSLKFDVETVDIKQVKSQAAQLAQEWLNAATDDKKGTWGAGKKYDLHQMTSNCAGTIKRIAKVHPKLGNSISRAFLKKFTNSKDKAARDNFPRMLAKNTSSDLNAKQGSYYIFFQFVGGLEVRDKTSSKKWKEIENLRKKATNEMDALRNSAVTIGDDLA